MSLNSPFLSTFERAETLPEMESQGEYEGQNFNFTSTDNMDNSGSQNLTKLTTANIEDMEEYYNFGKDTSSYTTPWVLMDQRRCYFPSSFLPLKADGNYRVVFTDSGGKCFFFSFLLLLHPFLARASFQNLTDDDGRPGRRHASKEPFQPPPACSRDSEAADCGSGSSFHIITRLADSQNCRWRTVEPLCCVYVSVT